MTTPTLVLDPVRGSAPAAVAVPATDPGILSGIAAGLRRLFFVLLFGALSGCAAPVLPACDPRRDATAGVFVIDHGWHTDLAIPVGSLRGPLASFRRVFPGMTVLLVGFGRRTFMTAPVTGLSDLLIGPLPGDGTVLVAGLRAPPDLAYRDGHLARLPLDDAGARHLSDFVWNTFRLDASGSPVAIASGFFPGSRFYATRIGYSGLYTCNSWTEDALHRAGLAPAAHLTLFSSQVMAQAGPVCAIAAPNAPVRDARPG